MVEEKLEDKKELGEREERLERSNQIAEGKELRMIE